MPSLTLTFSGAVATRLQDAIEETFRPEDVDGNPVPATADDLKDLVVNHLKQVVRASETRVARREADLTIADVDVT
jgi:hypothetical protein